MKRHIIVTFAAGTFLTLAACGKSQPPTHNPPPPEPEGPSNPPMPVPDTVPEKLPTWDEVKSGHPEGATNPPGPELIVTPEGDCYKKWVGGMIMPQGPHGDRVEACEENCGTKIQCPPKAKELLDAYNAGKEKPQPK